MVKLEHLGANHKGDVSAVDAHQEGHPGSPAAPVHYLHELPFAEEQRLEELFKKLDKDSNGRIDIHDLSEALKDLGLCGTYAEVSEWGTVQKKDLERVSNKSSGADNESSNSVQ